MRPNQRFMALVAIAVLGVAGVIAVTKIRDDPEHSAAAVEADRKLQPTTSASTSNSPAASPRPATLPTTGREPAATTIAAATLQPTVDTQSTSTRTHTAGARPANSVATASTTSATSSTHAASAASPVETPTEWGITGSNAEGYTLQTDRLLPLSGSACAALIASPDADTSRFGALFQTASARGFAGKRLEFSGYIATKDAPAGASIWLRADASDGTIVGFEDMLPRAIRGTQDWSYQAIVMDIPPD